MVNRNDTRGGCEKQKVLKTCGVASIVSRAMMKKGFAEIVYKPRWEGVSFLSRALVHLGLGKLS
jgi:hypothetical protein